MKYTSKSKLLKDLIHLSKEGCVGRNCHSCLWFELKPPRGCFFRGKDGGIFIAAFEVKKIARKLIQEML